MKLNRAKYIFKSKQISFNLNTIFYTYKRYNWKLDLKRYFKDFRETKIDRPIFLLGTKGSGLTFISRMIRRNKKMVSVTGNYNYWAGADEMASVLGHILPEELRAIEHRKNLPQTIRIPAGWLCGIDKYVENFRNTETDINRNNEQKTRKIVRWLLAKHSLNNNARFIDKSQVYTLKVSFLNEILKDCDPKFILITRNPYAICYRAAQGDSYRPKHIKQKYSFNQRLKLACQHWSNYMKFALKDSFKTNSFIQIKFEDFLENPKKSLQKVCDFAELKFNPKMLPGPKDKLPFGSVRRNRWYPPRTEVNKKYLDRINQKQINIIKDKCGKLAEKLGYVPPKN